MRDAAIIIPVHEGTYLKAITQNSYRDDFLRFVSHTKCFAPSNSLARRRKEAGWEANFGSDASLLTRCCAEALPTNHRSHVCLQMHDQNWR